MPSLPVTKSGRLKSAMLKGATSCAVTFTALTGLKALIGAATEFPGPGFLLPTRNHEVFEWCLSCELKLVFQMTLMTTGLYNEPAGAYIPSILY